MEIHVLVFIVGLFNIILADGRLIQRNKTKDIEEVHTDKPNPVIRLTRDAASDFIAGYTKEESAQSEEFIKFYNRRARNFDNKPAVRDSYKVTRNTKERIHKRDSRENVKENVPTTVKQPNRTISDKPKKVPKPLVAKPIPKFKEVDYEDFQSMLNNVHITADSGDHEDEDFNLYDYDFDVNHDEYISASGRKHIEPRIRIKNVPSKEHENVNKLRDVAERVTSKKAVSNKKERSAEDPKQIEQSKDTEYYDEANDEITKGHNKGASREINTQEDQYHDENEEKESNKRKQQIRKSRSWNTKLIEHKLLKFLPLLSYDKL